MTFKSGFVAIVGRPNVGKSTLLNHLVGQKVAIMSDKPQTTRNKIRCVLNSDEGQVVFVDTPGIHKPKHKLGELMVQAAKGTFREVDAILYVVEADAGIGAGDRFIMDLLREVKTPIFLVVNKIDLVAKENLLPLLARFQEELNFSEVIPISALEGSNTTTLVKEIFKYLPEGPQYYPDDMITDHPERFVVSELIREKVLHLTRDEIPHAIVVEVEEMKERPNDMVYIQATIYVERDSQKGIIVGKGGKLLKEIGALARGDIQNLLGSKVFLDLWVKVKKDWRNRDGILRNFGFHEE